MSPAVSYLILTMLLVSAALASSHYFTQITNATDSAAKEANLKHRLSKIYNSIPFADRDSNTTVLMGKPYVIELYPDRMVARYGHIEEEMPLPEIPNVVFVSSKFVGDDVTISTRYLDGELFVQLR